MKTAEDIAEGWFGPPCNSPCDCITCGSYKQFVVHLKEYAKAESIHLQKLVDEQKATLKDNYLKVQQIQAREKQLQSQLAEQTERVKELSEWLKSAGESIKDHCSESHAECIPMCGQGYIDKAKELGQALNQETLGEVEK